MTNITSDDIPFADDNNNSISFFGGSKGKGDLPLAGDVLVKLMLDAALSVDQKQKLVDGKPLAIVIETSSGAWVTPVGEALESFADDSLYRMGRINVPRDLEDPHVIRFLSQGKPVAGVSNIPDTALPPTLLALADARIKLGSPTGEMIAETMRRCLRGHVPFDATTLDYSLLEYDELCGCITRGSSPITAVDKLRRLIDAKVAGTKKKDGKLPRLEDAIEYGEARDWALNLRDDIKDYKEGKISWDSVDRGAIFHGPPGTGKTLLAQMLGEACGIPTVVTSVAEYVATSAGYLDSVIKAQRKAFDEARKKAPCILFLDELNALPNADTLGQKNRDYWLPVILDFYTLLDGAMADREGIVVIGATNRLIDINPALLRPGRFERSLHIGPPDAAGAERILRHHLGEDLKDADLGVLARIAATQSATGADLMEKVRAARRVARRAGRPLQVADLEAQISPPEKRSNEEVLRIAAHEAGHALVAAAVGDVRIQAVTVISHGNSSGTTEFGGRMIRSDMTRRQLENTCQVMLAGRAAEQLIMGDAGGGCGGGEDSDLGIATKICALLLGGLGMGSTLSYRTDFADALSVLRIDPSFRRQVDELLADLDKRTKVILQENEAPLRDLIDEVLKRRYMTGEEVTRLLANSESVVELEIDSTA